MPTPKLVMELRLSPRAGREGLAATVPSFRFTENAACPLSGSETTENEKPTLVFNAEGDIFIWGEVQRI